MGSVYNKRGYKSGKTVLISGMLYIHLKNDCINEKVMNGIRKPILFIFSLDEPPRYRLIKVPRIKLYKKTN